VKFSGTFSELPIDLFVFGVEYLQGVISIDGGGGYPVTAHKPADILEWTSSMMIRPSEFFGNWYPYESGSMPFIDADIVQARPLIEGGGSFNATYRSHTILSEGTYRAHILSGSGGAVQILSTVGDINARLRRDDSNSSEERIGTRCLFNDVERGFYYLDLTGESVVGQVQVYEGCLLNLEGVGTQTVISFDAQPLVQVYGLLDRGYRRNSYLMELKQGDVISIGAQPFSPPIGANDYHVTMEFTRASYPLWDEPITLVPNVNRAPETLLQTYIVTEDGHFSLDVLTEHTTKDTDYCLTFLRGGAIDVETVNEALSVIGRVE